MAPVRSRSIASGALAAIGLIAAGVAIVWKGADRQSGSIEDAPANALQAPEPEIDPSLLTPPDQDRDLLRRRGALGEQADDGEAARSSRRDEMVEAAPKLAPPPELRRDMLQAQKSAPAGEAGPIEFIVKLKDTRFTGELQDVFQTSPDKAARRLKAALGGGRLLESARLQGFTLGGEAILRWEGPTRVVDYGARQAEIQRALSAAPGVSYAEQNYTADLQSGR